MPAPPTPSPFERTASVEERFHLLREVLQRLLGLVFLIAFVSAWVQIEGLVGTRGILPIDVFAADAERVLGASRWWRLPTLLWLAPEDWALEALCAVGVALSTLALLGVGTVPVFAGLWIGYLSLAVGGQTFFQFQWDGLLLETALATLLLAPWGWRPGRFPARPDPWVGVWLWRLLVFKLMFLSGVVKLLSDDQSWWTLRALEAHFETQPLPTWIGWYAHQLPPALLRLAVGTTLVIEIAVPFLIFWSRGSRRVAAALLIGFQVLIAATGNYGFFNLLSIVLCLSLLDDAAISRLTPASWRRRVERREDYDGPLERWLPKWKRAPRERRRELLAAARLGLAGALVLVSALVAAREMARSVPFAPPPPPSDPREPPAPPERDHPVWLRPLAALAETSQPMLAWLDPFRSVNGYGLFRAMTLERPEIVIEASDDGSSWREVRFRYKPGDLTERPALVAPHMPRLDWQMWFAALDPRRAEWWLEALLFRLGTGEPAVLELVGTAPFGAQGPAALRLVLYDYRFATPAERLQSATWWRRERLGELTPPRPTSSWRSP